MLKQMHRVITIVVGMMVAMAIWAKPAFHRGISKVQADGTVCRVFHHGDEHFHWITDATGQWLAQDSDGQYVACEAIGEQERFERRLTHIRQTRAMAQHTDALPISLLPRGLVLLVNFNDVHFSTPRSEIVAMLTDSTYTRDYTYTFEDSTYEVHAKGCAQQYFSDVSAGSYSLNLDVMGPVTVSQKMAYYGADGTSGYDKQPYKMIQEACLLVDDSVDFSQYDHNKDGVMDFVYVIYAGYGQADGGESNTIWPHNSDVSRYVTQYVDGVRLAGYACSNELSTWSGQHDGIGTFCHEFSHVLGLPDGYATNLANHKTLGHWDIMDQGCYNNDANTPPSYSAYERFLLGWLTPTLITDAGHMTLYPLLERNEAMLISPTDSHNGIGNDPNPTLFYLLENRQQKGWDTYLPGHGMLMTRIDFNESKWTNNILNNSADAMGIDIIEADGKAPYYSIWNSGNGNLGKPGDLFPYGATSYTGIDDHPIVNITETDQVIEFDYRVTADLESGLVDKGKIETIYSLFGQRLPYTDIGLLPQGVYIIKTTKGTYIIQL